MTMRKAINEKCRECIYDPVGGHGTWREQVEKCTSVLCPLYSYRPVTKKKNEFPGKQPEALIKYRLGGQ